MKKELKHLNERKKKMCDPDICKECRDCNPVETADCPGCVIKSARLNCRCRDSQYHDDVDDFTEALLKWCEEPERK